MIGRPRFAVVVMGGASVTVVADADTLAAALEKLLDRAETQPGDASGGAWLAIVERWECPLCHAFAPLGRSWCVCNS